MNKNALQRYKNVIKYVQKITDKFLSKTMKSLWSLLEGISTKWSFFLLKLSVQKAIMPLK